MRTHFEKILYRCNEFLAGTIVRFYNEIIAGVWAIMLIIPFDAYLTTKIYGNSEYNITLNYFIYLLAYTCFFLFSSALIPYFKERKVKKEIDRLAHRHSVTRSQMKQIDKVLDDVLIYKSFFSMEGFLQFAMTNLFAIGVVLAYFGIEGLILGFMQNKDKTIPIIYIMSFLIILILESFLDEYLVSKIREKAKKNTNRIISDRPSNKNLLMLILRNLGGGSSLSEKIAELLVEDAVDDIYEILRISSSMNGVSKRIKKPKFYNKKKDFDGKTKFLTQKKNFKRKKYKKPTRPLLNSN